MKSSIRNPLNRKTQRSLSCIHLTSAKNAGPKDPFLWAAQRKREAHRSVLVDNYIKQDSQTIVAYCQQFGPVKAAFAVPLSTDRNFLLVEFKSPDGRSSFINSVNAEANRRRLFIQSAECRVIQKIDTHKLRRHEKIPIVKRETTEGDDSLNQQMGTASTLSEQMQLVEEACGMQDVDIRLRFFLLSLLENIVSSLFHGTTLDAFGSITSQLGSSSSDIDLILTQPAHKTQERYHNSPLRFYFLSQDFLDSQKGKTQMMSILASYLRCFHPTFHSVTKILNANVPIIRFKHNSEIDIDVSSTDNVAVLMSKILFYLSSHEHRFKTLLMSIKFWAKSLGITVMPSGYPTNFTLTSLLIFFLQTKVIIPPFESFTQDKTGDDIILPVKWQDIFKTDDTTSADDLLIGFFEFYANFDYSQTMSIRNGECIEKWQEEDWPLKLENPLQPDRNIPRNVCKNELDNFVRLCKETALILREPKTNGSRSWGLLQAAELER
ncbi:hypothetical protein CAPTEDRAFT_220251 [Capitella teleta]|uniref:PAP-associated domain-containing protein n=1 Tax=Capitella teleta TaxID=283909 RepID=R7TI52_CAPTE|nr:hypothetical protein CAPTEDRAFT_220251 [Capitella teleta]|eukprot:ELT90760.1 hypothetical protein CAPTEDRAFT_220251 [Capitella teleta]